MRTKNPSLHDAKAFTMIELVLVMIIVSIMAGFGLPSYSKMVTRSYSRDAMNNLTIMHAAQALYNSRVGGYSTAAGLTAINAQLSLNVLATGGTTYTCNSGTTCVATTPGGAITVGLNNPILKNANTACPVTSSNPCCTTPSNCP